MMLQESGFQVEIAIPTQALLAHYNHACMVDSFLF